MQEVQEILEYQKAHEEQIKANDNKKNIIEGPFTIFDNFKEFGYTKEQILSVLPLLSEIDKKRIELRNGQDLDNPVISPDITPNIREKYVSITLPKIKVLLESKYVKTEETPKLEIKNKQKPGRKKKPRPIKPQIEESKERNEEKMKNKLTIYEYFNELGYTKEQVQDILSTLTEAQINILKQKNGNDLQNPTYTPLVTSSQWSAYSQAIKIILKRLEQKYKTNEKKEQAEHSIDQTSKDDVQTKLPNVEADNDDKTKQVKRRSKTIVEKFILLGYKKEDVISVIYELKEEYIKIVKLIDGDDFTSSVLNPNITIKDRELYYGTIIPIIKRKIKNKFGTKEANMAPKLEKSSKTDIEPPKEKIEVIESPFEQDATNSEISQEEYIKILELIKTPTFYELMTQLDPKSAIIIALRLGYIDNKYFKTESIANFLGVSEEEVRNTTINILNLYRNNLNAVIDKAIAYKEVIPTRKRTQ